MVTWGSPVFSVLEITKIGVGGFERSSWVMCCISFRTLMMKLCLDWPRWSRGSRGSLGSPAKKCCSSQQNEGRDSNYSNYSRLGCEQPSGTSDLFGFLPIGSDGWFRAAPTGDAASCRAHHPILAPPCVPGSSQRARRSWPWPVPHRRGHASPWTKDGLWLRRGLTGNHGEPPLKTPWIGQERDRKFWKRVIKFIKSQRYHTSKYGALPRCASRFVLLPWLIKRMVGVQHDRGPIWIQPRHRIWRNVSVQKIEG